MKSILGIDIGKAECHAALLTDKRILSKAFPNSTNGFKQLSAWLANRKVDKVHACMEATGSYGEALAVYLSDESHIVSVVNPSRIKAFGNTELSRNKTDKVDAALIARFCLVMCPEPWVVPSQETRLLQALVRRLENFQDMRQQECNRLAAPMIADEVRESITVIIATFDEQIVVTQGQIEALFKRTPSLQEKRDLLVSIPCIGAKTAAVILAELPDVTQLRDSRAAAAYAGLSPAHYQSGKGSRPAHLSKIGNARLRRSLFMPAVVAMRYNPALKHLTERLLKNGKPKMVIIGAIMRKLIVLAYAILRSGKAYEASLSMCQA